MGFWEFMDRVLREPPWLLALIVVAILLSHFFKIVLEFLTKRPQPNALIKTLETIVVLVLSYLAISSHYLGRGLEKSESAKWEPLLMTCLLVVFTHFSIRLYIHYKARGSGARH